MYATPNLNFDPDQNNTEPDHRNNTGSNLHDTIDKVAEKAKPAIDSLAPSAHRNVERLAFRGEQIGNAYWTYLETSKDYIKQHPLMSVGMAFAISYSLTKMLKIR